MKTINSITSLRSLLIIFLSVFLLYSCNQKEKKSDEKETNNNAIKGIANKTQAPDEVYEIITNAMEFKLPSDTLKSGWNIFRYNNKSNEAHFIAVEKYPQGKGLADSKKEIVPPFQNGMDLITEGKMTEAQNEFAKLPEWYANVEYYGGNGLTSPGIVSQSTFFLDPGTYILECYVKMPNGQFHVTQGMSAQITVIKDTTQANKPKADHVISIAGEEGITFNEKVSAGENVFRVDFKDQKQHENFLGHDVHIARMEEGVDLAKISKWMNWVDPKGLITPAPAGFKFIGGLQDMEAGKSGFFTVDLKPGNYILIAEVPNPQEKGMLQQFEVE